jgi:flagellar basal-body rod protein FlgB
MEEVLMSGIVNVLQFALDGLTQQQQAIANNLANASTPGFMASDVDFQNSLQQALSSPNGGSAQVTTSTDPNPAGTDGNNVDTGQQLVNAQQNTLQYQATVDLLNAQFALVQGATGGSFQMGSGS